LKREEKMDSEGLKNLLTEVRAGEVTVEEAIKRLKHLPYENLGFAAVDHHRALRCGFPEVIFCQGKESGHVVKISGSILDKGVSLLATRVTPETAEALVKKFEGAEYNQAARTVYHPGAKPREKIGSVAVISAGTSDLPVAEEAAVTSEATGSGTERIYDVGVAGIHRILDHASRLRDANAIVVVAGMEGALASVVGGLVDKPVVAVPTSVGYGASFGGLAPLLGMLNSCAAGVVVVNIDNGFGAGYAASLINREIARSVGRNSE
jgi:NCAIR mutase (PurE)-related protein